MTAVEVSPGAALGSAFGLGGRAAQLRTRLAGRLKLGLHATLTRYGLCRDLTESLQAPKAKIPIAVRRLQERDLAPLFTLPPDKASLEEQLEVAWRRAFIEKGAQRGYVAIDARDGKPCYVQWLFGADDNEFVEHVGGFPVLERHQALLENAYTPPAYRGLGIMSEAMALIAEHAAWISAREVLTFVDQYNVASLKGCQRAGFYPRLLHHRTRFAFGMMTHDSFEDLREGDPRRTARF
jgi:RimJ/RimL family protein N-acetyltransferase